jgi:protein kinase A
MTPPLSPARRDSEPHHGAPERDLRDAAIAIQSQIAEMEVDHSKPADTTSQGPLRLLEDEHVHLQKSGLRLSDFDVRGTLGQCRIVCWLILTRLFSRFVY